MKYSSLRSFRAQNFKAIRDSRSVGFGCGRKGLEAIVCNKICELIAADHNIELDVLIVPMDNKVRLLEDCGNATKALINGSN